MGCLRSVLEAELTGDHGHLNQALVMHRQQQATLRQLSGIACLASVTASQAFQWAIALETRVRSLACGLACRVEANCCTGTT